ncbi:hypothetical protein [Lentzea atacamensis]|uniref:hypothetical protein n=1 Tax=Lentzea atacamensis TaxID=531938 RepID=UPI001472AEDA|nr:hypothetical protein [Lentzea atacamensis]
MDADTLRFTWTYEAPLVTDTFVWRTNDELKTGTTDTPSLELFAPGTLRRGEGRAGRQQQRELGRVVTGGLRLLIEVSHGGRPGRLIAESAVCSRRGPRAVLARPRSDVHRAGRLTAAPG